MKRRMLILILCSLQPTISLAGICTDNGNGTMTDSSTKLVWLKNSSCNGQMNWYDAAKWLSGLASGACSLSDGSQAGDWRLPSIDELKSLIRGPGLPAWIFDFDWNDDPNGAQPYQWFTSQGFTAVQSGNYWSSSNGYDNPDDAWLVSMDYGYVSYNPKYVYYYTWPVRGEKWCYASIAGFVSDAATVAPLADAAVTIGPQTVQTSSTGGYDLANIWPDVYLLNVTKIGYEPQTIVVNPTICEQIWKNFDMKPLIPVTVTFSGTGGGTVSDAAAGISCDSTCQKHIVWNTPLNLIASPYQYSIFTGMSGAGCSGMTACALTVLAPVTVSANFDFDTAHSVWADGPPQVYYSSLLVAFDDVAGGVVRTWGATLTETLILRRPVAIKLLGGHNADYSAQTGETTLKGSLTIEQGSLVVDRVIIK